MKEQTLISIIVPVYNAERWIESCIESLIGQTYQDLEILLIDDGSTDRSYQMCMKAARQDERIHVIRKKNGGVSSARNMGLLCAKGKYAVFVDADDFLATDILEMVMNKVDIDKNGLYVWNFAKVKGQDILPEPEIFIDDITREEMLCSVISGYKNEFDLGNCIRAVWGKLFEMELIRDYGIRFPEGVYIGEDAVFLLEYLKYTEDIIVINRYGYYYRIWDGSAVQRYKRDFLYQSMLQMEAIQNAVGTEHVPNTGKLDVALTTFVWTTFQDLIRNGLRGVPCGQLKRKAVYEDAETWYGLYGELFSKKGIEWRRMPKFCQIEYLLCGHIPVRMQSILAALRERKRKKKWR